MSNNTLTQEQIHTLSERISNLNDITKELQGMININSKMISLILERTPGDN